MIDDAAWRRIALVARPPQGEASFLSCERKTTAIDEQRNRHRVDIRGRAGMLRELDESVYGVYSCDASTRGIGFFSPMQLFPLEEILVFWSATTKRAFRVRNCRRIDEGWYRCGAEMTDTGESPAACNEFFRSLGVSFC